MSLGTSAMFASYAQLQATSNNIANAAVEGYSRQEAELATAQGQYTGAGFFGRGVTVETVSRATNIFLTAQAASAKSQAASDSAQLSMLSQLQDAFGSGEAGLGYAATLLFNAFSEVAANPSDSSARQVVLANAEDLASLFQATSDRIESLQSGVVEDVQNSVAAVNALSRQVAEVNTQIAAAQGLGHTPNDLLDQRDQLISEISEYIEVSTLEADDGSMGVFVAGGQALVLGGEAVELSAVEDPYDSSRVALAISVSGVDRALSTSSLGGGAIAGLLEFQNEDLVDMRAQLGQLATVLASAVNEQQALGLDLNGNSGAALFAVGDPVVLAHDSNSVPAASVAIGITDPSALQASEYELRPDPANTGNYIVTRLSDGFATSNVADGDTIDGFTIDIGTPAPADGDRFLLQPVSTAAREMDSVLSDPRGLAAANPLTATAEAANTGTASIGALTIADAPGSAYEDMQLVFVDASGGYEIRDSSNAVLSSGTWQAGEPIGYNGFELRLDGVPADADEFAIDLTVNVAANNGNALALDALADAQMVGGSDSFTDAYAQTLADIGVRVQSATSAASVSAAVADRTQQTLSSEVGVNLDEEAARMIQFQQAYQAAGKIMQTAQKIFETLLSIGG
jgi:flagellar hook-associated protein 1 FlgK